MGLSGWRRAADAAAKIIAETKPTALVGGAALEQTDLVDEAAKVIDLLDEPAIARGVPETVEETSLVQWQKPTARFHDEPHSPTSLGDYSNDPRVQRVPGLPEMYRRAAAVRPELQRIADRMAHEFGGRAIVPWLKSPERALKKVTGDYGGQAENIKDLARGTIVFETETEARAAIAKISATQQVVHLKDRFATPAASGFRDANFNLMLQADGHPVVVELKVEVESIREAALKEHPLYEKIQKIARRAQQGNRPLTRREAHRTERLLHRSNGFYAEALEDIRAIEAAQGNAALHPAVQRVPGLRQQYEQAQRALPVLGQAVRNLATEFHAEGFVELKPPRRAIAKVHAKFGGRAEQMKDLARGRIVVKDEAQARAVMARIKAGYPKHELHDHFAHPNPNGYRAAQFHLTMQVDGKPAIVELRVEVARIRRAAQAEHPIYERIQAITRQAQQEGNRPLTPYEAEAVAELSQTARAIYATTDMAIAEMEKSSRVPHRTDRNVIIPERGKTPLLGLNNSMFDPKGTYADAVRQLDMYGVPRHEQLRLNGRELESKFASMLEDDPHGCVETALKIAHEGGPDRAPTFSVDSMKRLLPEYGAEALPANASERKVRLRENHAVHPTAVLVARLAFLKQLDALSTLPITDPRRQIFVTNGGCAAGKGKLADLVNRVRNIENFGAIWDAAGEGEALENAWILAAVRKRGLRVAFGYQANDPLVRYDGVLARAVKKARIIDVDTYADSYVEGVKNMGIFLDSPAFQAAREQGIATAYGLETVDPVRNPLVVRDLGTNGELTSSADLPAVPARDVIVGTAIRQLSAWVNDRQKLGLPCEDYVAGALGVPERLASQVKPRSTQ